MTTDEGSQGEANPYATRAQRDRPRFNNPRSPVRGNGRAHDQNFEGNATRFRPAAPREVWNREAAAAPVIGDWFIGRIYGPGSLMPEVANHREELTTSGEC